MLNHGDDTRLNQGDDTKLNQGDDTKLNQDRKMILMVCHHVLVVSVSRRVRGAT